jgi:hypothetical protein
MLAFPGCQEFEGKQKDVRAFESRELYAALATASISKASLDGLH